ncbi:MAG TPA: amidohydrolase family protein [Woeseiaceae bacterium]|nr:amidohydrolase family protein [Woeseiaceae bacterium]
MPTDGSRPAVLRRWLVAAAACLCCVPAQAAEVRVTEGTNLSIDVSPADGSLVFDLLGSLWRIPANGGDAERLTDSLLPARRPRVSPDGSAVLYQADAPAGPQLWRYDIATHVSVRLGRADDFAQQGDWHPGGTRIVYAAARNGSGLDLWERDLATRLEWRITSHRGDESAPAWSADGRHLCYILYEDGRWHLMLRPFAQPARSLVDSDTPLMAPSWRPDGTLITYLEERAGNLVVRMLILSDPPLERTLIAGEDIFAAAVSWRDRDALYYAADGTIKRRQFNEWTSQRVPFTAAVARPEPRTGNAPAARALPQGAAPGGDLVVRAARLYDGHAASYRRNVDILIRDGEITAIDAQGDRGDRFVLDIGDVTVLPGLIDVYAAMPSGDAGQSGARMLAFGVTTLVTPDMPQEFDATLWDSARTPGPRLMRAVAASTTPAAHPDARLRLAVVDGPGGNGNGLLAQVSAWQQHGVPVLASNWSVGLGLGTDLLLGAAVLPASPRGLRYEDVRLVGGNGPLTFVSGLADGGTPGLDALAQSRQAAALPTHGAAARRFAGHAFGQGGAAVVLGSRPSGLPAGLATQAELRALQAGGLAPAAALKAATSGAAAALGLAGKLGVVAAGARADLLLVAGDPLADAGDAANVVAVVRNGHFYSLSNLLERAGVE